MTRSITKTQRWLDLIAFLVKHRFPVTIDQVMAAVPAYARKWSTGNDRDRESVRRMFERDKDELRALGMPLETVTYSIEYGHEEAEGYRLSSRDFYLPYLRIVREGASAGGAAGGTGPVAGSRPERGRAVSLGPEDARVAVDALRRVSDLPGFGLADESRSALRKIAFDLDLSDLGGAPVLYVDRPGAPDQRARVSALMDAVRTRKAVSFRYHGIYRGEPTERRVWPYGLLFQHGHWYLVGHDPLREDIRVFRVGRMEGVEVNRAAARTPDYEVPADFDLDRFAGLDSWELGAGDEVPLRARIRFAFPASLWAERNAHGSLAEELVGGTTVREFDVHQVDPFLRWLQSFGGEAVVVGPPELREAQIELARQTADLYPEAPSG